MTDETNVVEQVESVETVDTPETETTEPTEKPKRTRKTKTKENETVDNTETDVTQVETTEQEPTEKPTKKKSTKEKITFVKQVQRKLDEFADYDGVLVPILVAYGKFEHIDETTADPETLFNQKLETYKENIYFDKERYVQHLTKLLNEIGVTDELSFKDGIDSALETFFALCVRKMNTNQLMRANVYLNTNKDECKYTFDFL